MDRLAAMETFVAVVDSGSFSAAARRLNVGQPAVSKLIAQLEERLGVKLLVRTTRGLTATEAGLNYYERARRTIEEADEAEVAARGAARSLTGKLRVSAMVTFARIHLIPRIPQFLARHPELEMDVVLEDRNVDLIQEGIDVGLCMGHLADSSLTAQRIVNGRRGVFGTTAYFARSGEPKEPGDLAAHEAVFPKQEPIERSSMNSWDDPKFVAAVEKTGRKKIVLSGLWTETCVALPTVQAIHDNYEVYVVEDCCGDVSQLAHDNAMKRVIQAGAKPVTALTVMLEWQRDWALRDTYDAVMDIVKTHCGAYGVGVEYAYTMVHGLPSTRLPEYVVPVTVPHK